MTDFLPANCIFITSNAENTDSAFFHHRYTLFFGYTMIILPSKKICFVCIPKNGTHSIYHSILCARGRRIGHYHEFDPRRIPRGYKTILVYRDAVDRAVSLYKDVVLREREHKRRLHCSISIRLHQAISAAAPDFEAFVDILIHEEAHPSPYLLKPQLWWFERFKPSVICPLGKLAGLLEGLTGAAAPRKHTSADIRGDVPVRQAVRETIYRRWDPCSSWLNGRKNTQLL